MIRYNDYPDPFKKFWDEYPSNCKGSKKEAYAEWKRLGVTEDDAIFLLEHIRERNARDPKFIENKFVVHACRFLKHARWEDDWEPEIKPIRSPNRRAL